jgi:hypothetical protein
MRVTLPRVLCSDEDQAETRTAVITRDKAKQRLEPLGWPRAEAQQLLRPLPPPLLPPPMDTFRAPGATGAAGGALLTVHAGPPEAGAGRLPTAPDLVRAPPGGAPHRVGRPGAAVAGRPGGLPGR